MSPNLLQADLDHILLHTEGLWDELHGKHIFITGGTGFFGCWLLESFVWANDKLGLDASATVLTRNPEAFRQKAPHLASHPAIDCCLGDVRSFEYPRGTFSHLIHAATDASVRLNDERPLAMFDTIVEGTRHVLDLARQCGTEKVLFTSSGAVYGKQPADISHVAEDFRGAPDPTDSESAYGGGKRAAELLCTLYAKQWGLETKLARCFAFVGPYLPLDIHFAIGNFISDGLRGGPIDVKGDGTPYRSYLYGADLAIWLWTILCRGQVARPYNVGSEKGLPIAEVARCVAGVFEPAAQVDVAGKATPSSPVLRYVPSTARARRELGLQETFDLRESIARTIRWHRLVSCPS